MIVRTALPVLLLLLPITAQAQTAGVYAVQGNEPGRGAYSGRVELTQTGSGYTVVREVEYATFVYAGRPVSTVWEGHATLALGGIDVSVSLDRMGWASAGAGIQRTPADGTPMQIAATFRPQGNGFSGTFRGQGPRFADRSETWTWQRSSARVPIWENERRLVPTHSPASPLLKQLLFFLFRPLHQMPWVQPYLSRPEFNAGIHYATYDRTDFGLLRQRPRLLRVVGRLLDDLVLEESLTKANAFGKTLKQKADESDRELPLRFEDAASVSGRLLSNGNFVPDGDGLEWTGDYAYSQALRYVTTGEPAALANVERIVEGLVTCIEIDGQPGEFARTLRTARPSQPVTGPWHAGQGQYAGLEYFEGGNNDMLKGLVIGGVAAIKALAPGHRLHAELARSYRDLIAHSPVVNDGKFNEQLINGIVSALVGPGPERDRYTHIARNPFLQLYTVTAAAGYHVQGISDWSGAQLELTTFIGRVELADLHQRAYSGLVNRLGITRAAWRQRRVRRVVHTLVAGGLASLPAPWAPYDASDGVWILREMPYPRPNLVRQRSLRTDWCASPYPELPWKFDWTQRNRTQGNTIPPFFETALTNFYWKHNPFGGLDPAGGGVEWPATDYLMAYWLGRAYGVIGPND